jgi:hypothetical protein
MMIKKIAHRGNTSGPNTSTENRAETVLKCIEKGFDVEIDLWYVKDKLYLGHDGPKYEIPHSFLSDNRCWLWIHCKQLSAMVYMAECKELGFNFFWHQGDDYTLTSRKYIWTYPGKKLGRKGIAVCPDRVPDWNIPDNIAGVCSDYIESFNNDNFTTK